MSTTSATGIFAGAFAAVFLALECSMKLCGSLLWNIDPSHGCVLTEKNACDAHGCFSGVSMVIEMFKDLLLLVHVAAHLSFSGRTVR